MNSIVFIIVLRVSLVNNHITFIEQIIIVLKNVKNNLSDFAVFSKKKFGKNKKKKKKENTEFSR